MSRCVRMGVSVSNTPLTDQDYADDAVLFTDDPSKWIEILTNFDAASQTMGLHTSWSKTHLQHTGHGTAPQAVTIQGGHTVDVVERFTYLGSDIGSCSRSEPDMFRRIGLASSVMGQLTCAWRQSRLRVCAPSCRYTMLSSCCMALKQGPSQNQTNRNLRLSRCHAYVAYLVYAGSTLYQTCQ